MVAPIFKLGFGIRQKKGSACMISVGSAGLAPNFNYNFKNKLPFPHFMVTAEMVVVEPGLFDGSRGERLKCASGMGFRRNEHRKQSNLFGEKRNEVKSHVWCAVEPCNRLLLHNLG